MPRSRITNPLVALTALVVQTAMWTAGAASAATSDTDADGPPSTYERVITEHGLEVVDTSGLVNTP